MAGFAGTAGSAVSKKSLQHILHISNPDALKRSGFVILDLEDEDEALMVARMIASATGRRVILQNDEMVVIATIPAAGVH